MSAREREGKKRERALTQNSLTSCSVTIRQAAQLTGVEGRGVRNHGEFAGEPRSGGAVSEGAHSYRSKPAELDPDPEAPHRPPRTQAGRFGGGEQAAAGDKSASASSSTPTPSKAWPVAPGRAVALCSPARDAACAGFDSFTQPGGFS